MEKITIESVAEFKRLCQHIVNDNMPRLRPEHEQAAVEALLQAFQAGMELASTGKATITL